MSIYTSLFGDSSAVCAVSFCISTVFTEEDNFEALRRLLHIMTITNKMIIRTAKLTAMATNIIVGSIKLKFNGI